MINITKELTSFSAVLGAVIAYTRKSQNIEQEEMANKMGLSQASYSRLESGRSSFSVDQMFQSADALNMNYQQLLELFISTIECLRKNKIIVKAQLRGSTTEIKCQNRKNTNPDTFITGSNLSTLISGLSDNSK